MDGQTGCTLRVSPTAVLYGVTLYHRHLRNINCLMPYTACLVCFISTVNGCSKKRKKIILLRAMQVAGTQQNFSSLYYLDVYASYTLYVYGINSPLMEYDNGQSPENCLRRISARVDMTGCSFCLIRSSSRSRKWMSMS